MPIQHRSDHAARIVFATPKGTLTEDDMIRYQEKVWFGPELAGYHELVDMRQVEKVEYGSPWKVREMAKMAVQKDAGRPLTRLAIVVASDLHLELAHMYKTFRESDPASRRAVGVFWKYDEALAWLKSAGA